MDVNTGLALIPELFPNSKRNLNSVCLRNGVFLVINVFDFSNVAWTLVGNEAAQLFSKSLRSGPQCNTFVVVPAKSVFFPVFLNTLQGIRNIPPQYVEMGRVFGFTRWQMLRRVIFPAAAPTIVVGIRFAAGLAWAMIVAAEMLSGRTGLGFLLEQSQDMLLTDHLFVVIVTIGVVGFVVDVLLRTLERRLFSWKEDMARA